jgi:hypothetical protein
MMAAEAYVLATPLQRAIDTSFCDPDGADG